MTGLMLGTELTAEQRDWLMTIRTSGEHLLAIINGILDFSKIESGKLYLSSEPFDLAQCVEESMRLVEGAAASKGLSLSRGIAAETPPAIVGDGTRLRQVLVNLLSNAVKFTATGEVRLTVEARLLEGRRHKVHFAVRDTGIGIPAGRLDVLFQSFTQVDASSSRRFEGTGLGLAISKRLCEMMGGRVWVESEPDVGSTFHFTIAASAADPESVPGAEAARQARPAMDRQIAKRVPLKILVVEDIPVNQKVILLTLKKMGYEADVASNGLEAIKACRHRRYQVILMDMQMPDMDGLEATRRIRSLLDKDQQPRIIAMTAHAFDEARQECFAAGMDDFISKPVPPGQLRDMLLRCGPPAGEEQQTVDGEPGGSMDWARLAEYGGSSFAEQAELTALFVADTGRRLRTAHEALFSGDLAAVTHEAHSIKGASASMGAQEIAVLAAALERCAQSDRAEGCRENLDGLEAEFRRVRELLEQRMNP